MTSVFHDVIGHADVLRILVDAADHPASGYLFVGPDGVGKRTVAERFARLLLQQPSELTVDAHPDFVRVRVEEGSRDISIDQARELVARMQLTAARGGRRVCLIEQADRLNVAAANALLKAVEEATVQTVYIFLAEQFERLPATLRSRLALVPFGRVASDAIRSQLTTRGATAKQAADVLRWCGGCPGLAERMLADLSRWETCEATAKRLLQTMSDQPVGKQLAVLEKVAQDNEATDEVESAWRTFLLMCMRSADELFTTQPDKAARIGQGLALAWRMAGSALSPRLALEWTAVRSFITRETSLPSFLDTPYV